MSHSDGIAKKMKWTMWLEWQGRSAGWSVEASLEQVTLWAKIRTTSIAARAVTSGGKTYRRERGHVQRP